MKELYNGAGAVPAVQVAMPEPFGMYVEREDGTTEFQRTGKAFSPTAQGYKFWTLYAAPVSPPDGAMPEQIAEKLRDAIDHECPLTDSPHTSVIMRNNEERAAMWRGAKLAYKVIAAQPAEGSAGEFNGEVLSRITTYLSQFDEFQPHDDDSADQAFRNIVECIERLRNSTPTDGSTQVARPDTSIAEYEAMFDSPERSDTPAPRELYECIGKGGVYELLGTAKGAGMDRFGFCKVYRDTQDGQLYFRNEVDFSKRMARIDGDKQGAQGRAS